AAGGGGAVAAEVVGTRRVQRDEDEAGRGRRCGERRREEQRDHEASRSSPRSGVRNGRSPPAAASTFVTSRITWSWSAPHSASAGKSGEPLTNPVATSSA